MKYPVFIVPTGIGCPIGGHAGDATPAMRAIAQAAGGNIITHPNVVNASALNEMPDGCHYVEGSMLDRFLEGEINLKPVRSNRVLVVVNKPASKYAINLVSAARAVCGLRAAIVELSKPLYMYGNRTNGIAGGGTSNLCEMIDQLKSLKDSFDAVAILTKIDVDLEVSLDYFRNGGVNPWGGVEAQVSRAVSMALNVPAAHAPVESPDPNNPIDMLPDQEILDPRVCAEAISANYAHCILKGLQRAPRICSPGGHGIGVRDVLCLVSPAGINGRPHAACREQGISVISVINNTPEIKTVYDDSTDLMVVNYLEAAGVVAAMVNGVSVESVIGCISKTYVIQENK